MGATSNLKATLTEKTMKGSKKTNCDEDKSSNRNNRTDDCYGQQHLVSEV